MGADPLHDRLSALVAELKALPATPGSRYAVNFVAQAEVWRIADQIAALLRESPEAALLDRALVALQEKFDAMTIAEVNRCNGIPALRLEEMELREAIAVVLEATTQR
jgi:hypothetical protein